MKMDPKNNDELLNSYIDGELNQRQQTQVKRMVTHDQQVARRLRQLQNCRTLITSLPAVEAPDEMLEQIKATLERKTLLGEQPVAADVNRGARHLLARKVLAAAAMLTLVAILAGVIYTIVAPRPETERFVAIAPEPPEGASQAAAVTHAMAGFSGRLELRTNAMVAVDAFINRAIEDNGLSDYVTGRSQNGKSIYSLTCSRDNLNLLLMDLASIWHKTDSAALFVETDSPVEPVVVKAVTADQTYEIINQDSLQNAVEVAANLAVFNSVAELMPGRELFSAVDEGRENLVTIPKPVLTGSRQKPKRKPVSSDQKSFLTLTIVVTVD
jgi:anti-sigma-K factor RskA